MQLQPRHPFSAEPLLQTKGDGGAGSLQHQIEVRKPLPGGTVKLMPEGIANGTSHQRQATVPLKPHLLSKGRRQFRGNAWKREARDRAHG